MTNPPPQKKTPPPPQPQQFIIFVGRRKSDQIKWKQCVSSGLTWAGVTVKGLMFRYLVDGSTVNRLMFFCMFSGVVWGRRRYKLSLPETDGCEVTQVRQQQVSLVQVCPHLSARTSRGASPWAQLLIIQAESRAARKPRATPVPIGQNGCRQPGAQVKHLTGYLSVHLHQKTPVLPPAGCLRPGWPAAGVRGVGEPKQHSLMRTYRWSQTWPHLAGHSGSWRSPEMEAGDWSKSQPPHERTSAKHHGPRYPETGAAGCLQSPEEGSHKKVTGVCFRFQV